MIRATASRFFLAACLLIPSAYLAWTFRSMPHLRATGDDQLYMVSGKSLAEGRGYRLLNLPNEPFQTKYPVLYAWALSGVWKLAPRFPGNLPFFMLASWLVLPLYLVVLRLTFRSLGFQAAAVWIMCALAALNPVVLAASTSVGPDLLFAALLLIIFLLLQRSELPYILVAGALAGAAYLLRTAVLPLLVTAPLYLLWCRRPRYALLFLSTMAPFVLSWSVWARTHMPALRDPTTVFYTDYFGDFLLHFSWHRAPALMADNFRSVLEYAGMSSVFIAVLAAPALWGVLSLLGAARLARKSGFTQFHFFALGYCALLVVWPYKPLLRYLLPVLPLVLCGFVCLLSQLAGAVAPARPRAAVLTALAALACVSAVLGFYTYRADLGKYASDMANERAAYAWIEDQLPAAARFVAAHPGVLYLYTGHQATAYEPLKDFYLAPDEIGAWRERLPRWAAERGVEYAFCDSRLCAGALVESENPQARAVLEKYYQAVFGTGPVTVYKLAPR